MWFKQCEKSVEQAGWFDLWATVLQSLLRGFIGFTSGSLGLSALGVYAVGDALSKAITLTSLKISKRPATENFPFGFGKILFVSSIMIGTLLFSSGAVMAWTSFTDRAGVEEIPNIWAIVGTLVSAGISLMIYGYLSCVAQKYNNLATEAAAQENRGDAMTSVMVLVGILLATLGFHGADHYTAFLLSLALMWMGIKLAWEALKGLLDVSIPKDALTEISAISAEIAGVKEVELVRGRNLGEFWDIYLHIAVNEQISVADSNRIVCETKQQLHQRYAQIQHIWVDTQPHCSIA